MKEPAKSTAATAMARKAPSLPLRKLLANNAIPENSTVLDFGCGQGKDIKHLAALGFHTYGYDKNWQPIKPEQTFDVVLATYVLNVITQEEEQKALEEIETLVNKNARVFIAVRRDLPKVGKPGRNCWQRWVPCPKGYSVYCENNSYAIFSKKPTQ